VGHGIASSPKKNGSFESGKHDAGRRFGMSIGATAVNPNATKRLPIFLVADVTYEFSPRGSDFL